MNDQEPVILKLELNSNDAAALADGLKLLRNAKQFALRQRATQADHAELFARIDRMMQQLDRKSA